MVSTIVINHFRPMISLKNTSDQSKSQKHFQPIMLFKTTSDQSLRSKTMHQMMLYNKLFFPSYFIKKMKEISTHTLTAKPCCEKNNVLVLIGLKFISHGLYEHFTLKRSLCFSFSWLKK